MVSGELTLLNYWSRQHAKLRHWIWEMVILISLRLKIFPRLVLFVQNPSAALILILFEIKSRNVDF